MTPDAFAKLKKKFTKQLKKPERLPDSAFMEMGKHDRAKDRYACEGDFSVLVDPEGDAWVFMGPHSSLANQVGQQKVES
jgi:hypothetical protein